MVSNIPNISPPPPPEFLFFAGEFYDRLQQHLDISQQELEEDEQLSVLFYTTAGDVIIVNEIGYRNPTLIAIYGIDDNGNESTVLSNVNATQVVVKITKVEEGKEKRTIGFAGEVR